MVEELQLALLGNLEVRRNGVLVRDLRSSKALALLCYLAVTGRPHLRPSLFGLLWGDTSEAYARNNLSKALTYLRQAVGQHLSITRQAVALDKDSPYWLDVWVFEDQVRTVLAGAASTQADIERLEDAVALYRGDFLEGFYVRQAPAFEEWVVMQRARLRELALQALHALVIHHTRRGAAGYAAGIDYTTRLLSLEPWREEAYRQLMLLLARSGQRGAALAQYEACRQILAEELGVEPEEETRALYERIREGIVLQAPPQVEASELMVPPGSVVGQETTTTQALSPTSPTPAQFESERRLVTAVSADVKGVVVRDEQLDIEVWAEVVSQALWLMESEAHRYGGEVGRMREDGLIALFGAADAHEDDPERAVLAALAIQEAIQGYAAALVRQEEIELRARVGVDTGEAVVAHIGDGQQHVVTVKGEAVSLASRIQIAARPGAVLVGENTYRLVRPLFEWEAPGEIAVEGVGQPLAVYRPLTHKSGLDKPRGIVGLESPLVGRAAELRALQGAIEGLQAGIGGIVTLVGEAGIGKSRLVAQVRKYLRRSRSGAHPVRYLRLAPACNGGVSDTQAQLREDEQILNPQYPLADFQWVEGRCLSYATTVAYQFWVDALRGLLGAAPDAAPGVVRDTLWEQVQALCGECVNDVYPYIGRMMSLPLEEQIEARLRGLDGESLRFLTFRAVETLVERAAGQRALVLVCEDLHWADPTSIGLLEQLLALIDRVPLLVICVFRPEKDHGCWRIKETAARLYGHRYTDLWLDPLTEKESVELVRHLLHIEKLPEGLRARILGHAEGNPFYVEEILRSLIDGGIVAHDETAGRWRTTRDVADIPVPDTLRGVLMARIDRLPEAARRLLQLASVVGRIFGRRVLEGISQSGHELDDGLVTLQRAQMIRQRARLPEAEYIFKHQLTQEAAYDSLLGRKRQDLHRRVARALEQLYPEHIEEQLGLLAHHWERAGDAERAVIYLRRSGERAARQYANDEAVGYLSRALALTPKEKEGRYDLLLAREKVYELQGKREAQLQDLTAMEELADALADDRRRAEVALRRAHFATRVSDYSAAAAAAQRAVRLAQAAQDVRIEAMGQREWGRALRYQWDLEGALPHLERALTLAQDVGLRQVEVEILHTIGNVWVLLGDLEKTAVYWEHGLRVCRQMGDRRREGEALRDVGWILAEKGNYIEAEDYMRQSLRACRETGNRRDEAQALLNLSLVCNAQGDSTEAREVCKQALHICREVHDRRGAGMASWCLGRICTALTEYATARECFEHSLRLCRETYDRVYEGRVLGALGRLFHLQGDYTSAGNYYEQALRTAYEAKDRGGKARALLYKGLLSHHLGDDLAAREYSQQALLVGPDYDDWDFAHVFSVLGHALSGLGHYAEAVDAYRQDLTLRRERGQHHLAVEPLGGLARVALAQGDPAGALAHVGEILDYMEDHPALWGTLEPLRIYLTCCRVLLANGDPHAEHILDAAYRLLQERAATIEDQDLRRSYLENVAAHREIVATWKEISHR